MIALIILPLSQIICWTYFNEIYSSQSMPFNPAHISLEKLPIIVPLIPKVKFLGFLASMIPTGIAMAIVIILIKLFGLYRDAKIFSSRNVRCIKHIGYLIIIGQLITPFYEALMTLILTMNNPVGERMIRVSFTGMNLFTIVFGLMIILIAWVMDEGRKIKQEMAYTV